MPETEIRTSSRRLAACLMLTCLVAMACNSVAKADPAGDRKRAQLQTVKRLLILPPFFGTDTLGELPPTPGQPVQAHTPPTNEKRRAELADYTDKLKKLEKHAEERLMERSLARLPYELVTPAQTAVALKGLMLTPPGLFANGGRIMGKRFDVINIELVKSLAAAAHADAILLGALDEPRKSNGYYYFDPLAGAGYESPKVNDRATFYLYMADGSLVLKHPLDVFHPLTRLGGRAFLLEDWMETEDLLVEDLMDEVTRFTPIKK